MNTPPLKIEESFFTELSIISQQNAKPEDLRRIDPLVQVIAMKRSPEDSRNWFVTVSVEIKPKEGTFPSYLGKVEAAGLFTVDDSWKDESKFEQLVYVNGATILYSSIREMICIITSRCVWETLTIPCQSFFQMFQELIAERQEASKKEAAKSATVVPPETKAETLQKDIPNPV